MQLPLSFMFFSVLLVLTFFGISISCIVIWLKSSKETKSILHDINKHWSLKGAIYYGIFFSIFTAFAVFISIVMAIAIFFWNMHV